MTLNRFKVRVFIKPSEPRGSSREDTARAFFVDASNADVAATKAREKLTANNLTGISISHAPGREIIATVNNTLIVKGGA